MHRSNTSIVGTGIWLGPWDPGPQWRHPGTRCGTICTTC